MDQHTTACRNNEELLLSVFFREAPMLFLGNLVTLLRDTAPRPGPPVFGCQHHSPVAAAQGSQLLKKAPLQMPASFTRCCCTGLPIVKKKPPLFRCQHPSPVVAAQGSQLLKKAPLFRCQHHSPVVAAQGSQLFTKKKYWYCLLLLLL